jgi:hypothetical protein
MHTFDTHAFVKAFVNAKTDEEKAEILAKNITETRQENSVIIDNTRKIVDDKFEKSKNEIVTKKDLKETELLLKKDIESMKVDLIKWIVAIMGGQIAILVLIIKFFFNGVGDL